MGWGLQVAPPNVDVWTHSGVALFLIDQGTRFGDAGTEMDPDG